MFESVNLVAVVVSSLLAVAVGSVWYSPLVFGTLWMKGVGRTEVGKIPTEQEMIRAAVKGLVVQLVFFFSVAQLVALGVTEIVSVTRLGILLVLMVAAQMANAVIWEGKPLTYFLINSGYLVVTLFGGMAIIIFWPW